MNLKADWFEKWLAAQDKRLGQPACPYPIKDQHGRYCRSVKRCVAYGFCGCSRRDELPQSDG